MKWDSKETGTLAVDWKQWADKDDTSKQMKVTTAEINKKKQSPRQQRNLTIPQEGRKDTKPN